MAKPIDVNVYDQTRLFDLDPPMPKWRWVSKITGPDIPDVDYETLVIESITLPNGEIIGPNPSFGGGRTTYFPDFPEVSTISVSFYETELGTANLSLTKWREAVLSQQGWYGLPSDYKCMLLTNLFGYASNTQAVMGYKCLGVWPTDGGTFDLDYTNDDRLIIQATLSCDRIIATTRAG